MRLVKKSLYMRLVWRMASPMTEADLIKPTRSTHYIIIGLNLSGQNSLNSSPQQDKGHYTLVTCYTSYIYLCMVNIDTKIL